MTNLSDPSCPSCPKCYTALSDGVCQTCGNDVKGEGGQLVRIDNVGDTDVEIEHLPASDVGTWDDPPKTPYAGPVDVVIDTSTDWLAPASDIQINPTGDIRIDAPTLALGQNVNYLGIADEPNRIRIEISQEIPVTCIQGIELTRPLQIRAGKQVTLRFMVDPESGQRYIEQLEDDEWREIGRADPERRLD